MTRSIKASTTKASTTKAATTKAATTKQSSAKAAAPKAPMAPEPPPPNRFAAIFSAINQEKKVITIDVTPIESRIIEDDAQIAPKNEPTTQAKSTNPDYQRTTLYLPKKLHRRLKLQAINTDREMSAIIEDLILEWLDKDEVAATPRC